ncbi:MAG TPA: WG repeat-containing protein, partial [Acholeplasmataceae bacterium]|nr:WG repeat-containing protein [Acholeplasmataceae bacterium]
VRVGSKLGFIDNKGREVVKPVYDKIEMFDVQKNDWAMVEIDGRVGFIDKEGKFIQE